jgi:hypothetical protein
MTVMRATCEGRVEEKLRVKAEVGARAAAVRKVEENIVAGVLGRDWWVVEGVAGELAVVGWWLS